MNVWTFGGTHPFNPQHLVDAFLKSDRGCKDRTQAVESVADLLIGLGESRCFRCGTTLDGRESPNGSRVTDCRCIPICPVCSEAEVYEPHAARRIHGSDDGVLVGLLAPVCDWPVDPDRVAEGIVAYRKRYGRLANLDDG